MKVALFGSFNMDDDAKTRELVFKTLDSLKSQGMTELRLFGVSLKNDMAYAWIHANKHIKLSWVTRKYHPKRPPLSLDQAICKFADESVDSFVALYDDQDSQELKTLVKYFEEIGVKAIINKLG